MAHLYPFIDGLPIKNGDLPWQTVSHNQLVTVDHLLAYLTILNIHLVKL